MGTKLPQQQYTLDDLVLSMWQHPLNWAGSLLVCEYKINSIAIYDYNEYLMEDQWDQRSSVVQNMWQLLSFPLQSFYNQSGVLRKRINKGKESPHPQNYQASKLNALLVGKNTMELQHQFDD